MSRNTSVASGNSAIWMDGAFMDIHGAHVDVLTHGLHYATSVFEGIRVYDSMPFMCIEHFVRLHHSASVMGMHIQYSAEQLVDITKQLIAMNNIVSGYVRPVVWLGSETMLISGEGCTHHIAVAVWNAFEGRSSNGEADDFSIGISKWTKGPHSSSLHSTKSASIYAISRLVKNEALSYNLDDCLMLDSDGYITECSTSNFFAIIDGVLHTPAPGCFLNGITRQTIIMLAKKLGIDVIEKSMTLQDLQNGVEGAFVTGTAVEIKPASQIVLDDKKLILDKNHHIITALMQEFYYFVQKRS